MPRPIIQCASCGESRPKEARGLCEPCYQRHRKAGTLDQFKRSLHRSIAEWLAEMDTSDTRACWPWPGSINEDGYGIAWSARRMRPAHRVVYEHLVGPIPDGMTLDHECHDSEVCREGKRCPHRRCVNPGHLVPRTHVDNARRSLANRAVCSRGHAQTPANLYVRDGRTWCKPCRQEGTRQNERARRLAQGLRVHATDDECINGHKMTPENTYRHPQTGYRECMACRRASYRRYYARKKARQAEG